LQLYLPPARGTAAQRRESSLQAGCSPDGSGFEAQRVDQQGERGRIYADLGYSKAKHAAVGRTVEE
jgi:hypothetical protein